MLTVSGLTKSFAVPSGTNRVVDDVSFEVAPGQCFALLGPSGCGKTTTLRCVAGLEQPDSGVIQIAGETVCDPARGLFVPVHERPIGMVFQSYAIWPHMSVFDNVAYPLTVSRPRLTRAEIRERTMAALALVGMETMAERPATRLSGGQQQRVALARATVREPKILLLDEPLSNLDARLRESMRVELAEMIARIHVTALFVTHDQAEALALSHRLAVMNHGRIEQEGAPEAVYRRPRTGFVATFLGGANLLPNRPLMAQPGARPQLAVDSLGLVLALPDGLAPDTATAVMIRPEHVSVRPAGTSPRPGEATATATLRRRVFLGAAIECHLELADGTAIRATGGATGDVEPGDAVAVAFDPADVSVVEG